MHTGELRVGHVQGRILLKCVWEGRYWQGFPLHPLDLLTSSCGSGLPWHVVAASPFIPPWPLDENRGMSNGDEWFCLNGWCWLARRQPVTEEKSGERQKGVARIRSKERLSKTKREKHLSKDLAQGWAKQSFNGIDKIQDFYFPSVLGNSVAVVLMEGHCMYTSTADTDHL